MLERVQQIQKILMRLTAGMIPLIINSDSGNSSPGFNLFLVPLLCKPPTIMKDSTVSLQLVHLSLEFQLHHLSPPQVVFPLIASLLFMS